MNPITFFSPIRETPKKKLFYIFVGRSKMDEPPEKKHRDEGALPRPPVGAFAQLVSAARKKTIASLNPVHPLTEEQPPPTDTNNVPPSPSPGAPSTPQTYGEFMKSLRRVPRRGEVGLTAEDVASAESLGYQMSGSRSKAVELHLGHVKDNMQQQQADRHRIAFVEEEDVRADRQLHDQLVALARIAKKKRLGESAL